MLAIAFTTGEPGLHVRGFCVSGRLRTGQHDCSICLSDTVLAIETNCGHVFCGECMFTYYSMANTGYYKRLSVILVKNLMNTYH